MDSGAAALIGAGAGATVAIASQFIAHELSTRRDRRDSYRRTLTGALIEAGRLLYRPDSSGVPTLEEFTSRLPPDSVWGRDPEFYRQLQPLVAQFWRGIVLLWLHLGRDHPLTRDYLAVTETIREAEEAFIKWRASNEQERREGRDAVGEALKRAQDERTRWVSAARELIETV